MLHDDDDDDELLWLADDLSDRLMTGIVYTYTTDLPIIPPPPKKGVEKKIEEGERKNSQTDDEH